MKPIFACLIAVAFSTLGCSGEMNPGSGGNGNGGNGGSGGGGSGSDGDAGGDGGGGAGGSGGFGQGRGMDMPWVELQAEDAETNATILGPSRIKWDAAHIEAEAIGRKAVRLAKTGDQVTFTV